MAPHAVASAGAVAQEVLAPMQGEGYCECGCGQRTWIATKTSTKMGWRKGEPVRFIRGHQTRVGLPPEYVVNEATGCWVWQRAKSSGYGVGWDTRGQDYAHRIYYRKRFGSIPDGLQLDHLCRNRACVNPDHLEPVSIAENLRRGMSPSAVNARKTHCPKGHPLSGENLYVDPRPGKRGCKACRTEARRQQTERERMVSAPDRQKAVGESR